MNEQNPILSRNNHDLQDDSPLQLHFQTYGTGDPILLLHGFGANLYSWRHFVPSLSKDYKLILFDLKGFGSSPKPSDENYSFFDQAILLHQFIIQHDLRNLTIIGHSFGGGVALATAIKLEEEGSDRLSSLILIDSAAYPQPLPMFIKILRMPILGSIGLSLLPMKYHIRSVLKLAYYDDRKITEEAIEAYAAPLNSPEGRHALVQTARQMIPPNIKDITTKYKMIKVPTFILWGRDDAITPIQVGKRLHNAIPNSQLMIIEQTGHIPHEENPDKAISAIQNFLMTLRKPQTDE